jgi:small-conductance mechanosensitive channel
MQSLVDVLLHPSRWSEVDALAPETRIILALAILVLTAVAAIAAGALSHRWARRRAAGVIDDPRAIRRVRRGLIAVVSAFGVYLAVDAAPLPPRTDQVLSGVVFVFGALVAARLLIHALTLIVASSMKRVGEDERERLEREYVPLVTKVSSLAVALILIVVVAKHFGQDVTSLVAALGVGSLAIGLAAQQTLGNMIAGFTLLVDRPFRPGDRIKLATGEMGEVLEIGVRSTRIVLVDRNLLVVPNTELVNSRVVNYAFPTAASRGEVRVTIGYESDVERATQLLEKLAADDERVSAAHAPAARVIALGGSGVELAVGFEAIAHGDVAAVEDRLRRRVLTEFAAQKISLPFPRTDVYLINK